MSKTIHTLSATGMAVVMSVAISIASHGTAAAQRLSIGKTTIDVGRTAYEVPVTATFELRNKGLKTIAISDVKADCGCTRVDFPKKGISAGERFTIAVTYDARMLGHFNKQVAVTSNATREPLVLRMKGVVVSELKDYTKTHPYDMNGLLCDVNNLEFDDVNKGDHPGLTIGLVNNTDQVLTPNLLHLPPYLSAVAMPERLAPDHVGKVLLTLDTDRLNGYGLTQTSIYLAKQLGDKVSPDIELPVSVVLLPGNEGTDDGRSPRLQLSSQRLDLGMRDGKNLRQGSIAIANDGQDVLDISSLQMFTAGMKVTLGKRRLQPGETTRLKVSIDRDRLLRSRTKPRVLMITNDPRHQKVIIDINVK